MIFHTPAGLVTVSTERDDEGLVAELTSVAPRVEEAPARAGRCRPEGPALEPVRSRSALPGPLANAGSQHLILVVDQRQLLADLDYDFDQLAGIMREHGLVTVALMWRESRKHYHARNPFAGSGVVEDPATGAAAAAFGGYLREIGKIGRTARFTISQGTDMGRPSSIEVSVIRGEPGVRVRARRGRSPTTRPRAPSPTG